MRACLPPTVVLYNLPSEAAGASGWAESDAGVMVEVRAVQAALLELGCPFRLAGVRTLSDVPAALSAGPEPVVFNLVEGFHDRPEEACWVPALCRAMGRACTGSGSDCLHLALDKWRSKAVLRAAGVPVPAAVLVPPGHAVRPADLPAGPYIVKPAQADGSEGIHADRSVVDRPGEALARAVRDVHRRFGQPALVEQYIDGRELNVSLLQRGGRLGVLAVAEVDFDAFAPGRRRIVDYAAKWLADSFEYRHTPLKLPAPLEPAVLRRARQVVLRAGLALGCADYARVDLRLDAAGSPLVIEVNPNPDISPEAGLAAGLAFEGIGFAQFVRNCLDNALRQQPAAVPPRRLGRCPAPRAVTIRRTGPRDRDDILRFVKACGFFRPNELEVAAEVLDEALAKGPDGHYQSFTARHAGRPVGWVCCGPTPCTAGTFDVYWIAVAPGQQGRGIGAALMRRVERLIARCGGRQAVVETSGQARYEPTRRFYRQLGYAEVCRVPDFYAPGDDKLICVKTLRR